VAPGRPSGGDGRWFAFFFQAEDGIRDFHVTGVQTCALPISDAAAAAARARELVAALAAGGSVDGAESVPLSVCIGVADTSQGQPIGRASCRGRGCRTRAGPS